ncbi:hypothetical protein OM076_34130 [Solirubrobacter ginsenosidimutans]|uniref:Uncharacterized protein n=1 Tax=Solirubrobacter ginsenosidimutans TaxID=490573 RepID=A0A9X3S9U2_9ACTN|nr:hypothetical protein [Solirubrobacter ginsenosidimutans]MDA0165358.1 hypothetical protein [Solirubrobacter ginsenosidimutans]
MRTRPITALLAALALLAVTCATSFAQTPTPTPTDTPTPTATAAQDDGTAADPPADASKEVKAVYTDYSRDGVIDVCEHTRAVLQETLDGIEAAFDRDFPDFREAVKAGIQRHDKGRCDEATATPTATATATASPDATSTASPESGALPPPTDDGGSGSLPPATESATPESGTLPPTPEGSVTPAPPVATPTVAPAAPAATPTPVPTPSVVTRSNTSGLLIPGILVGIALLGALGLALAAVTGRSPSTSHAFSEAAYRFKGTWADFSDWLRFGR